jgi:hypothetical protein
MRFLILLLLAIVLGLCVPNTSEAGCGGTASGRSGFLAKFRAHRPARSQTIFRSSIRTSSTYSSGVIVAPQ